MLKIFLPFGIITENMLHYVQLVYIHPTHGTNSKIGKNNSTVHFEVMKVLCVFQKLTVESTMFCAHDANHLCGNCSHILLCTHRYCSVTEIYLNTYWQYTYIYSSPTRVFDSSPDAQIDRLRTGSCHRSST